MTTDTYKTTASAEELIKRVNALEVLRQRDLEEKESSTTFHVEGLGKAIVSGYESLRNSAEYTESNTLFQRAMVRFFVRAFHRANAKQIESLAKELIVELTLSGYIENNSITEKKVAAIKDLIKMYWDFYNSHKQARNIDAKAYVFGPLAARIEDVLFPYSKGSTVVQFAYEYFAAKYESELSKSLDKRRTHLTLLIATAMALIKPTEGTIREDILARYHVSIKNSSEYIAMNRELDVIFNDRRTKRVVRKVSNRCAPFRVLLRQIEKAGDISDIHSNKDRFMTECGWTVKEVYNETGRAIRSGVIKSIIFLIITKTIIGISIEIPYDFAVEGGVVWLPLVVNLLFPPIYMLILSSTLVLPGEHNTKLLEKQIEDVLYVENGDMVLNKPAKADSVFSTTQYGGAFNFFYWLFFLVIVAAVSWGLLHLGFSPASFIIFFIFVSTASFLAFRLSRLVREVESRGENNQSIGQSVRDFLYMPFVVIGQWVSEKYAKINLVSNLLDIFVELPMKDLLRAVRRWNNFLSSKKDEL